MAALNGFSVAVASRCSNGCVIQQDWTTNSIHYDAIIGDGVLNFTPELAEAVLSMASHSCHRFVVRVFSRRLPIMRVAQNFPAPADLSIPPTEVRDLGDYRFYAWSFDASTG